MDPIVTWKLICEPDVEPDERLGLAEDLLRWINRGGFHPDDSKMALDMRHVLKDIIESDGHLVPEEDWRR